MIQNVNIAFIIFKTIQHVKSLLCRWFLSQNLFVLDRFTAHMMCQGIIDIYRKVSNIRRTLVGNKIVDHSDVFGASPVGAAPTTSSFST